MSTPLTVECSVNFHTAGRGRKELRVGPRPAAQAVAPGRVPLVSRLMALAIRFEGLLRGGAVESYAELARLGHVTRARLTQVMNLTLLAPDIQEALLFLPRTQRGRAPLILRDLQPLTQVLDWNEQRRLWAQLTAPLGTAQDTHDA